MAVGGGGRHQAGRGVGVGSGVAAGCIEVDAAAAGRLGRALPQCCGCACVPSVESCSPRPLCPSTYPKPPLAGPQLALAQHQAPALVLARGRAGAVRAAIAVYVGGGAFRTRPTPVGCQTSVGSTQITQQALGYVELDTAFALAASEVARCWPFWRVGPRGVPSSTGQLCRASPDSVLKRWWRARPTRPWGHRARPSQARP